jgi:hypothetical protein
MKTVVMIGERCDVGSVEEFEQGGAMPQAPGITGTQSFTAEAGDKGRNDWY